jgi:hypothetical protein
MTRRDRREETSLYCARHRFGAAQHRTVHARLSASQSDHLYKMPIEDGSVEWPQALSPSRATPMRWRPPPVRL